MPDIRYLDFDIELEPAADGYRVEVNSPAGQSSTSFRLPFSELEIENFLLKIGQSRRTMRRIDTPETEATKIFGARLFDALFAGDVRACLRSSIDEAGRQGCGLRIRLRLTETPELAGLPWEYLYNPAVNRFLALSVETPLVRYLELPERIRPLAVTPPLRVLALIASPRDHAPLDVEREWQRLRAALGDLERRGLVTLERIELATLAELQRRLRRGSYHVLHFVGHGGFNERRQDGELLLEDEERLSYRISGQDLGMLLHDHRSLRLVVLNACDGARSSRIDPFAGSAQSLVQQGLPAVIAMQFEVSDDAALMLAREFYGAVADGYPVDAALSEARKSLFASQSGVEWGTPVLYLRAADARIFDVAAQAAPIDALPPLERQLAEPHAKGDAQARGATQATLQSRISALGCQIQFLVQIAAVVVVFIAIGAVYRSGAWQQTGQPQPTAPLSATGTSAPAATDAVGPTAAASTAEPSATANRATPPPTATATPSATAQAGAEPSAQALAATAAPKPTTLAAALGTNSSCDQDAVTLEVGSPVNMAVVSPDGKLLAAGSADNLIRIWDLTRLSQEPILSWKQSDETADRVTSIAFSPNGAWLASAGAGNSIKLWNVTDGALVRELGGDGGHSRTVQSLAFSPDGRLLASGSDDRTIKLWRVDDAIVRRTLIGHTNSVWGLAFSPDSQLLISGAFDPLSDNVDPRVLLWNTEREQPPREFVGAARGLTSVAFSPDGAAIAAGSWDKNGYLWNFAGEQPFALLEGNGYRQNDGVRGLTFSPDSSLVATSATDGNLRLFLASDGTYICSFQGHTNWANSVVFDHDGRRLVSGSGDGTIRIWRIGL